MSKTRKTLLLLVGAALAVAVGCAGVKRAEMARATRGERVAYRSRGGVSLEAKKAAPAYARKAAAPAEQERLAAAGTSAPDVGSAGWSFLGLKVIRTGTISLEVEDAQAAQDKVVGLAFRLGGFVGGNNFGGSEKEGYRATIVLRLPNARLDEALRALRDVGKVTSISVSSEDVSQRWVELEAQIRNKQAEEAMLLQFMKQVRSLSDILTYERELTRVRGEIESARGQLNYLADQVALSTLTVNVTQKPSPVAPAPQQWKLSTTAKIAWRTTMRVLGGMARAGLWLGVTAVIWIPVLFELSLPVWVPDVLRRRRAEQRSLGH